MKKIFYYTDVLPFLGNGEAALDKLIYNLQAFKDASSEIRLVWHPWSQTEEYMKLNDFQFISRYREIVNRYRLEAWGDLVESSSFAEVKEILLGCDGYYGDSSNLAYEAKDAGIPVMVQNIDVR